MKIRPIVLLPLLLLLAGCVTPTGPAQAPAASRPAPAPRQAARAKPVVPSSLLPRVMVIMDEKSLGTIATAEVEAMAIKKLIALNVPVVDQDMVRANIARSRQMLITAGDNRGAAALGTQFGADIVLIGEAVAKPSARRISDTNLRSYQAVATLRAVRTDNSATLAAALLGGTPLSRRAFAVLAGGCLLSGFTYAYTAFFAAFVLALALGLAALSRRGAVRPLALALLLTVGGTGLNLLPTLEAWEEEPGTRVTATSYKLPHHADLYGLRIRDLLTPVDAHPLPPLRHLAALVAGAAFPGSNENTSVRLGLVGSVGFLLLLGVSLLGTLRAPPGRILGGALQPLASLSLGCLLLGTVGGLGSLFNLLVIPDIRCYNRISVFVAFFALAAVGLVLDQFFRRLPEGFRRGALALLLVCGLLDQRVEGLRGLIPTHREAYEALKATVREVEGSLPPETRIYQCPYYGPLFDPRWLRGGTVPPLLELGPYIVSEKLRWSAGALTARGVKWNEALAELSFDLLGDQLVAQGFGGLWVDRLLFEDDTTGARAVGAFEKTLGAPRISGEEGRFLLFDLAPRRRALEEAMGSRDLAELAQRPPERFRLRWGERATFEPGGLGGLFLQEGWGAPEPFGRWTVARRGSLALALPTPRTPRVRLRWEVAPFILPGQRELQRVTLAVGEEVVGRFALRSGGRHALETTFSADLLPAGNLELRFELPDALAPEAAGLASDWRELGLFSYALTLEQVP